MADRAGIRILHNATAEARRAILRGARKAVEIAAADVEAAAKERAPVDTGFLRSSISHQMDESGAAQATVDVGAEYGAAVEMGTVHRGATPYLRPATEQVGEGFDDLVRDQIADALRALPD